jgi:hypothetical protein
VPGWNAGAVVFDPEHINFALSASTILLREANIDLWRDLMQIRGVESVLHKLSYRGEDRPRRVCEASYVPVTIEEISGTYFLKGLYH